MGNNVFCDNGAVLVEGLGDGTFVRVRGGERVAARAVTESGVAVSRNGRGRLRA